MKKIIEATATPLASIFGSGFLVIVPIMAGAVGSYAVAAMGCVCLLAYAVGSVIRFNIRHAEPLLKNGDASERTRLFEHSSDFALVAAYIVSVCLYIEILADFLLGGLSHVWTGIHTDLNQHLVTVTVIAAIGIVGYTKGLAILQKLENVALGVTLLIIMILLVGFAAYDVRAVQGSGIQWPTMPGQSWWKILTIVGGTLIVVQGFETSRYLGQQFDADTRIRSSRISQIISTVVYLVFLALATPLMHFLGDEVEANSLIMLARRASLLLPIPLVIAAVLSQFSAAVADTMAGGGNMVEVSKGHVVSRCAYILICGGAMVLAFAPTMTILALASRAFAFYYMLQCIVAITISKSPRQRAAFGIVGAVLAFIAIFAVPAG